MKLEIQSDLLEIKQIEGAEDAAFILSSGPWFNEFAPRTNPNGIEIPVGFISVGYTKGGNCQWTGEEVPRGYKLIHYAHEDILQNDPIEDITILSHIPAMRYSQSKLDSLAYYNRDRLECFYENTRRRLEMEERRRLERIAEEEKARLRAEAEANALRALKGLHKFRAPLIEDGKVFDLEKINKNKSTQVIKAKDIFDGMEVYAAMGVDITPEQLQEAKEQSEKKAGKIEIKIKQLEEKLERLRKEESELSETIESRNMTRRMILKDEPWHWLFTDEENPKYETLKEAKCLLKDLNPNTELRTKIEALGANIKGNSDKVNNKHGMMVDAVKRVCGRETAEKLAGESETTPKWNALYNKMIDEDCMIIVSRDEKQFCLAGEGGVQDYCDSGATFSSCHNHRSHPAYHTAPHWTSTLDRYFIMRIVRPSDKKLMARAYFYINNKFQIYHTGMYSGDGWIENGKNNGFQSVLNVLLSKAIYGHSSFNLMTGNESNSRRIIRISREISSNPYFNENNDYLQNRIEPIEIGTKSNKSYYTDYDPEVNLVITYENPFKILCKSILRHKF